VQLADLDIAATSPLPLTSRPRWRSSVHAFEAALCCEDADVPLPCPRLGRLHGWTSRRASRRIESRRRSGDSIAPFYDSMYRQLITHADIAKPRGSRLSFRWRAAR